MCWAGAFIRKLREIYFLCPIHFPKTLILSDTMPFSCVPKYIHLILLGCALSLGASGCGSDMDDENSGQVRDTEDTYQSDAQDFDTANPDADSLDASTDATTGIDASADATSAVPPQPWSVFEPGYYQVGYTQHEIVYDARGTDEPRTLRVAVWYPTTDTEGRESRYYERIKRPQAFRDASVAIDAAEPAPLLVFSHGNASMAEQSYFMTEFYASHGWVVVAPDHTGNTLLDTVGAIDLTSAVFRSQDISAVIDFVFDLDSEDPLNGLISEDDIVLSGHSFGAVTTLASSGASFAIDELTAFCEDNTDDFCEILDGRDDWGDILREGFYDPRIKVAIPQAPGGYRAFQDGIADIETPTLLFTGRMDDTLSPEEEGDPIWEHMEGSQHLRIDVIKGGHFTFSNICDVLPGVEELENDGCSEDFIDPNLAYELINAYSLSFARAHLFGGDASTDALLNGQDDRYADSVELMRK